MLNILLENLINIFLVIVGLSAFGVYFWQKHDDKRTAATLLKSQINSIEKNISVLKEDHRLGNTSVYHAKKILNDNSWEKYKHLFVKILDQSEVDIIQKFFDNAEQIERARLEILNTMIVSWTHQSLIQHEFALGALGERPDDFKQFFKAKIDFFNDIMKNLDLAYTPEIAISSLVKALDNFTLLSGTTAYQKIQKYSFDK